MKLRQDDLWGGEWTAQKLEILRKYLHAYTQALKKWPFLLVYVDAFAGSGYRENRRHGPNELPLFPELEAEEAQEFLDGSPRIALQIERPFNEYLFIEKSQGKVGRLRKSLRADFPALAGRCKFETGDCNRALQLVCRDWDRSRQRGVFFLDPFGMQVDWSTIEAIAATKRVDLWLLFPISAVQRLLRSDGLWPEGWQGSLDRLFGTQDWRGAFYETEKTADLFEGEVERLHKKATFGTVCSFYLDRLRSVFPAVADNPYWMYNSRHTALFVFCFAMANPSKKAQALALNIATDILEAQDGS